MNQGHSAMPHLFSKMKKIIIIIFSKKKKKSRFPKIMHQFAKQEHSTMPHSFSKKKKDRHHHLFKKKKIQDFQKSYIHFSRGIWPCLIHFEKKEIIFSSKVKVFKIMLQFVDQGHLAMSHSGKITNVKTYQVNSNLCTTNLHQVNSKLF